MDSLILYLIITPDYFTIKQLATFKMISKTTNYLYKTNYEIIKLLSANRLHSRLLRMGEYRLLDYNNEPRFSNEYVEIIKIACEILFDNIDPDKTVMNRLEYKNDKVNPLKHIRYFRYEQIKERKKNNITLQLALDHAEKPDNLNKIREIFI